MKESYGEGLANHTSLESCGNCIIDWIFMLPEELNKIYYDAIKDLGENKKMPYVMDLGRYAMEKGFIIGEIANRQKVLINQMTKKFKLTKIEEELISNEFN